MAPIRLAPRVYLFEEGTARPELSGNAIALAQIPSQAFGDGSHPTTRGCAAAVDLHCRLHAPRAVLDVGTGTGILARIARARGVPFVVGTDIDTAALEAARANADLDSAAREIVFSDALPDSWGPRFDLIVANILEGPLRTLAPSLERALAPGGMLFLSGFTPLQIPFLLGSFTGAGLSSESESVFEGWALLSFLR